MSCMYVAVCLATIRHTSLQSLAIGHDFVRQHCIVETIRISDSGMSLFESICVEAAFLSGRYQSLCRKVPLIVTKPRDLKKEVASISDFDLAVNPEEATLSVVPPPT